MTSIYDGDTHIVEKESINGMILALALFWKGEGVSPLAPF